MDNEQFEEAMYDEMQNLQQEDAEDTQHEQFLNQQEFQDAYGSPEPEQRFNQHTFLANSLEFDSPEKVTFMTVSELGTPLFNMRFLLDIEDISKYYLDEMAKKLGIPNEIALYFREKIKNISDSGMSHNGFVQNLNVTKKMEATRQRIKNLPDVKGGRK